MSATQSSLIYLIGSLSLLLTLLPLVVLSAGILDGLQNYRRQSDYSKINKFLVKNDLSKSPSSSFITADRWAQKLSTGDQSNILSIVSHGHLISSIGKFSALERALESGEKCSLDTYKILFDNVKASKLDVRDLYIHPERPRRRIESIVAQILTKHNHDCRRILPIKLELAQSRLDKQTLVYINDIAKTLDHNLWMRNLIKDPDHVVGTLPELLQIWTLPLDTCTHNCFRRQFNESSGFYKTIKSSEVVNIYQRYILNSCKQYSKTLNEVLNIIDLEINLNQADHYEDPMLRPLWVAHQTGILCNTLTKHKKRITSELISIIKRQ